MIKTVTQEEITAQLAACRRIAALLGAIRRVREGALELGGLPPGKWRYLTEREVRALGPGPET